MAGTLARLRTGREIWCFAFYHISLGPQKRSGTGHRMLRRQCIGEASPFSSGSLSGPFRKLGGSRLNLHLFLPNLPNLRPRFVRSGLRDRCTWCTYPASFNAAFNMAAHSIRTHVAALARSRAPDPGETHALLIHAPACQWAARHKCNNPDRWRAHLIPNP